MKKRLLSILIGLLLISTIAVFGNLCRINEVEVKFSEQPVGVRAETIYTLSEIEMKRSILGLNETSVKYNIMHNFEDNSVSVTDIVRVFPDKVIVYIEERIPLCAVPVSGAEGTFAIADKDFQLNMQQTEDSIGWDKLIRIDGISVDATFNTPTFAYLRSIFTAFEEQGINHNALAVFIAKINISTEKVTFYSRDGKVLEINRQADVSEAIGTAYAGYLTSL